jgi:arsenate reductase
MTKPAVLFLCTNNAVRSQMAEAIFRRKAADAFDIYSAGSEPREIHPLTIRVMNEVGIDVSGQRSKDLRQFLGRLPVHFAIFVCQQAEDSCPINWPGALQRLKWPFEDPAACDGTEQQRIAKFRSVRDQIRAKIDAWMTDLALPGR